MCPLRLILIFLSATLAGFFLIRNLKSRPQIDDSDHPPPPPSKARLALQIQSAFWACPDMASGRYLWRHLFSSKPSASSS